MVIRKLLRPQKIVNLALQGGGAHGAFTWGVLDRLLEDDRLAFDGISGTSAGAMNAVVFASGFEQGGSEGAREALQKFWRAVSRDGRMSPIQRSLMDRFLGNWSLDHNPAFLALDVASRFLSPYDFNPFNINPLREILEREVDFEAVRACRKLKLFISATNVRTGKARIFRTEEITADAVMASACLPFLFQAVEIDGTPYWDGGYVGNPPLYPFFRATSTDDVILVQTNPIKRAGTPQTAREILNRINEITFNASLLSEFRAIGFVRRLIEGGMIRRWTGKSGQHSLRLHRIAGSEELADLNSSSKFNTEWPFFLHLRDLGRDAADAFLKKNFAALGRRATLDPMKEVA
ncbi:MAG: patatin-like phospholipase family protein [Bradyrhizobiaceae bacterium]|nr:patatin-like phospholipase family protein [Bradyrhizobiaceae bacterium]